MEFPWRCNVDTIAMDLKVSWEMSDKVDRLDLVGIGRHDRVMPGPHDHGRDQATGPGRIIVKQSEHGVGADTQRNFLVHFAQSRLDRGFARIHTPAGQGPLALVALETAGTPGQHEGALARLARDQGQSDRRAFKITVVVL